MARRGSDPARRVTDDRAAVVGLVVAALSGALVGGAVVGAAAWLAC